MLSKSRVAASGLGDDGDGWRLFAWWNERLPTVGELAFAAFWVAILSGVALVPVFDPEAAADSLQLLYTASPVGILFRALHYWSGQLVLVLSVLHVVEHLARGTEARPRAGVWLRLAAAIPLTFYLMVSGFILKGDAEGGLARQVLAGLLERLPLLGDALRDLLLGTDGGVWVVYPWHAAVATVLALVVIVEHFRRLWPSAASWLLALGASTALALLAPPAVREPAAAAAKGPWYMLGTQEILHWLPRPGWLWALFGIWLGLMAALPWLREPRRRQAKAGLLAAALLYLALTAVGAWLRGPAWRFDWGLPWPPATAPETSSTAAFTSPRAYLFNAPAGRREVPTILGRREGCMVCHADERGLAPAHDPAALGCFSCHLGDPWTGNADLAHAGMEPVPGNLRRAAATCGSADCHREIVQRVGDTLMATGRGLVGVDRFVFGESPTPDSDDGLPDLGDSSADSHLRELCLPCHLAYPKEEPGPVDELSRGGGCTACHLNYSADGPDNEKLHPTLDLAIGDNHCFGCHSRSGRISTNYEGWHETVLTPAEIPEAEAASHRTLDDGRVFVRQAPDVHQAAGMACVDCHTSREAMGDGRRHRHQEEQLETACADCHRTAPPVALAWDELTDEDRKILQLRRGEVAKEKRYVTAERSGLALLNLSLDAAGRPVFAGKLDGKERRLLPPPAGCTLELAGHERLACQSCHSQWVPQCLGCHTQRTLDGGWQEYRGSLLAEAPTLGVREAADGTVLEIRPFAPGMILTVNQEPADPAAADADALQAAGAFHRLFSPAAPHTTNKAGRSCKGCHNDPLALGVGRGELVFGGDGRWIFSPAWGPLRDGLPADAWTAFLPPRPGDAPVSTRIGARPFTAEEQRRILATGACLTCHDADNRNMRRIYNVFDEAVERLSPQCREAIWD